MTLKVSIRTIVHQKLKVYRSRLVDKVRKLCMGRPGFDDISERVKRGGVDVWRKGKVRVDARVKVVVISHNHGVIRFGIWVKFVTERVGVGLPKNVFHSRRYIPNLRERVMPPPLQHISKLSKRGMDSEGCKSTGW
jgi:hypothetical protein